MWVSISSIMWPVKGNLQEKLHKIFLPPCWKVNNGW